MPSRFILPALTALGAVLVGAAPAAASEPAFTPGHVVVRYAEGATRADRIAIQKATGTSFEHDLPGGGRSLDIENGASVKATIAKLRRNKKVAYANPDYDKLWDQAVSELDAEKRAQLFVQMNDIVINDFIEVPLVQRAAEKIASASGRISAPAARYCSSL